MERMSFKFFNYLIVIVLFSSFLQFGCAPLKKSINTNLDAELFQNSFHGLVIVDGETKKTIYDRQGGSYFTPASNVKIFTLYTGLQLLPKNIPTLKYNTLNDTVFVEGTGDPSWMHPYFNDSTGIVWLQKQSKIALNLDNYDGKRFGPGWAWEDYDAYFSPEISSLPLYGNVVTIFNTDSLGVLPPSFKTNIMEKDTSVARAEFLNNFYYPTKQDTIQIPYKTSPDMTRNLLEELVKNKISLVHQFPNTRKETLYGIETDSIFKQMMYESDNFLAEQLLLTASSTLFDTLSIQKTIDYMLENDLNDLEQEPRWVDGSGLSRYNLFTPKSMVQVLQKMYDEIPKDRLFSLFPIWDSTGTVSQRKNLKTIPFIYAKSGSLGNNYNLSGYLLTKSGRLLIFSFMNNHFKIPIASVRQRIYSVLNELHARY